MSASAPNPKNLMLLAGLGIGVYWLASRRAAPVVRVNPSTGIASAAPSLAASVGNLLAGFIGKAPMPTGNGAFLGAGVPSGVPAWDQAYANALQRVSSSSVDGVAFNPFNTSVQDSFPDFGASTGGDGAFL